jgi:O-antigen ligase
MDKIAFIIYLVCIVFGVLFFGAIHTWAYTIVFLGVIAASLLLLKGAVVRMDAPSSPQESNHKRDVPPFPEGERDGRPRGAKPGWYLRWVKTDIDPLFFFFIALFMLQMLPLPGFLLILISPEAKITEDMSLPAAALDPAGLAGQWYALAPFLYPVRMSLIRWAVYGLLFFGLIRCLNTRKRIETAIITLLLLCCFDALYGIIQTYSGNGRVWWFKNQQYARDVCGTYLNRNHFAGLMEMGIALAVAYAGALGGKGEGRHGLSHRRRSFKKRFLEFFSEKKKDIRRFLVVFAGGVLGLGLILSASRGGIIATTFALLLMGLFFTFRKSERRKGRAILILCAISLIYGLHAGLDYTVGRFEFFDRDLETRWIRAEKAVDLFKDYPYTGVGAGNFRHAYGKYQDPRDKLLYVDYAHNDYAQFLAEAGIIGGVLLLAGTGWYAVRSFRVWRRRDDPFAVCLGIAPFGALFALAIHSFSDYNLHRPANVMVLIAVVAIGYAALHLEGHRHGRMNYGHRLIPLRWRGLALLVCATGLILWCGIWTIRHFVAETYCNTEINITLNLDQNPSADEARAAMAWDPGNAAYPHKFALALMDERDRRMQQPAPDTEGWKRSHGPIIANLERAILLNPMNAQYHVQLGWEYSYLYDRPDHAARWLPAADLCIDRAAWFAGSWPQNPSLQYDMGNYRTMRSKTFGPGDPKSEVNWAKAVWHYRKGVELEGKKDLPEGVKGYIRNFYTDEAHRQPLQ